MNGIHQHLFSPSVTGSIPSLHSLVFNPGQGVPK